MTTQHNGVGIAQMREAFDPDESRWLWFSWFAAPLSSQWLVPDDWQIISEQMGLVVLGDYGAEFPNCNGVLLSTSSQSGTHLITNRCTFSNGEVLERTVEVKIKQL